MIKSVKKIKTGMYLINENLKLSVSDEDMSVNAEFNEEDYSDDEVNTIIDEFFEGIFEVAQDLAQRKAQTEDHV